jgi:5-methylcytosine-specific restriction protein A
MPTKPQPKIKPKSFNNKPLYDKGEYNTTQWRKLRMIILNDEPICRECKLKAASVIDHIQPIRLGGEFWAMENLQPLCTGCHNSKSGKESKL